VAAISSFVKVHRDLLARTDVIRHAHRHNQRLTVSVEALVTFARVAEIVTVVLFDAGRVVETVNVVLVAPAGTVMLLGTVAILG